MSGDNLNVPVVIEYASDECDPRDPLFESWNRSHLEISYYLLSIFDMFDHCILFDDLFYMFILQFSIYLCTMFRHMHIMRLFNRGTMSLHSWRLASYQCFFFFNSKNYVWSTFELSFESYLSCLYYVLKWNQCRFKTNAAGSCTLRKFHRKIKMQMMNI